MGPRWLLWERRSRYVVSNGMLSDLSQAGTLVPEAALTPPKILVVEDDFLIRMMLVEVLIDEGFEVIEAESGDEALTMVGPGVALVVTDIQLPGSLNGHELMTRARQLRPTLPAIYTSGRLDYVPPAGPLDVSIAKPYQVGEICAAIKRLLAA
jgi:CheY-like chemotaxis protein